MQVVGFASIFDLLTYAFPAFPEDLILRLKMKSKLRLQIYTRIMDVFGAAHFVELVGSLLGANLGLL